MLHRQTSIVDWLHNHNGGTQTTHHKINNNNNKKTQDGWEMFEGEEGEKAISKKEREEKRVRKRNENAK